VVDDTVFAFEQFADVDGREVRPERASPAVDDPAPTERFDTTR
jgi:hypothetical protein